MGIVRAEKIGLDVEMGRREWAGSRSQSELMGSVMGHTGVPDWEL